MEAHDEARSSTTWRRHLLCAFAAIALATLLPRPAPAQTAPAPCKLGPPQHLTEGACRWWVGQPAYVFDNSMCCKPILDEAQKNQEKALKHDKKAKNPRLPKAEQEMHRQKAAKLFNLRRDQSLQFRDCVNEIRAALNLQIQTGQRPNKRIGDACGCRVNQVEKVGWRCCVGLGESPYLVDQYIRSDNAAGGFDYNCHYYTKMYIHTVVPEAPYPERNEASDIDCVLRRDRFGFEPVRNGKASVGDIVLVRQPGTIRGCDWAHSGIVTAVDEHGNPLRIRQKDGQDTCVVDLSWEEFQKSWVNLTSTTATILHLPGHPGKIP